jgi:hypothetical protein
VSSSFFPNLSANFFFCRVSLMGLFVDSASTFSQCLTSCDLANGWPTAPLFSNFRDAIHLWLARLSISRWPSQLTLVHTKTTQVPYLRYAHTRIVYYLIYFQLLQNIWSKTIRAAHLRPGRQECRSTEEKSLRARKAIERAAGAPLRGVAFQARRILRLRRRPQRDGRRSRKQSLCAT